MKHPIASRSTLLAALSFASSANAVTMYVAPGGFATNDCATRETACDLSTGASKAQAGDNVVLTDGVYTTNLYVASSGTPEAWITFQADECATPIIEGEGAGPDEDLQSNGVGSAEATYVRFVGIVARGWNIGFGNGWTAAENADSNGHWEYKECLSYSNGRTGFTFFSAEGIHIQNCIAAHNGSSVAHSWSSGITLLHAAGSSNVVEGNVSFENTDAQNHSDGSGFIVDEQSNDATFVNNIAFGNGGSCFRMTRSSGTKFLNNTCYHNARNPAATGPTNPSEIYFTGTNGVTQDGVSFMNNVLWATGSGPGMDPVFGKPNAGWSNNVEGTGPASFFTDPEGTTPDFTPGDSASSLVGQGATGNGIPTTDIGLDPKCLVKRDPVMVGAVAKESWWEFDVDIDYIKSIGGVKQCFNAAARSGTPDVGAYRDGAVTSAAVGACVPASFVVVDAPVVTGVAGGAATGSAGGTATGQVGEAGSGTGMGGATATGAMGGGAMATGTVVTNGSAGTVTGPVGTAGGVATATGAAGGAATATGGVPTGTPVGAGGNAATATGAAGSAVTGGVVGMNGSGTTSGGCAVAATPGSRALGLFAVFGLGALIFARRRRSNTLVV